MVAAHITRSASSTRMTTLICIIILFCTGCRTVVWSSKYFHEDVPTESNMTTNLVERVDGLLLYYDYDRWMRNQYFSHLNNTQGREVSGSRAVHYGYDPIFYARYKNAVVVDIWSLGGPLFLDCGDCYLFATYIRNDDYSVDEWDVVRFVSMEKQTCRMAESPPIKIPTLFEISKAKVVVKDGLYSIEWNGEVVFNGRFSPLLGYCSFEYAL